MTRSLTAAIILTIAGTGAVSAAPLALAPQAQTDIVLVAGGCGPGFHRGPGGACVAGRRMIVGGPAVVAPAVVAPVRLPPPCPRGYVRDPRPAVLLCYPRF